MKLSNFLAWGCAMQFTAVVFYLIVSYFGFAYCIDTIFGKHLPWIANLMGGLVGGTVAVPLGIIFWILRLCGVHTPFVHLH